MDQNFGTNGVILLIFFIFHLISLLFGFLRKKSNVSLCRLCNFLTLQSLPFHRKQTKTKSSKSGKTKKKTSKMCRLHIFNQAHCTPSILSDYSLLLKNRHTTRNLVFGDELKSSQNACVFVASSIGDENQFYLVYESHLIVTFRDKIIRRQYK